MELTVGSLVILVALVVFAAVRVRQIAPWRAVAQIAIATGSLKACVEFIRFCEQL